MYISLVISERSESAVAPEALGLAPFDVGGNGDCFFRAVSHQLYSTQDLHTKVRSCAILHVRENPALYYESITAAYNCEWERYISRMSTPGTWCDEIIVRATATSLLCLIHITHSFGSAVEPILVSPLGRNPDTVIFLGFIPELHYVSTVHITTLDGWCGVQNTKTKRVKEQLLNHQTNKKVKKTSYAKKIVDLKNKGVEEITGPLLKQQQSLSAKCTSEGKKNYFLKKESENLVSQQWVAKNMEEFHKSIQYKIHQCSVCFEVWPQNIVLPRNCNNFICDRCKKDKSSPKRFSVENNMIPSKVPIELQGLTQIEEMLISRAFPVIHVYVKQGGQRGYSGHCINFPQNVSELADVLPRCPKDLALIIVNVKGYSGNARSLFVRRSIVLRALQWLIANNPVYSDVQINYQIVSTLPQDGVPDELKSIDTEFSIKPGISESSFPEDQQIYDTSSEVTSFFPMSVDKLQEVHAIEEQLSNGTSNSINWPSTEGNPLNEYKTPYLATMAFPTLFPDSKGDPTNLSLCREVSFADRIKHLIKFGDISDGRLTYRFACHPRFSYWALNMIQRKRALQQTAVYLKQNPGDPHIFLTDIEYLKENNYLERMLQNMSRYTANILGSNAYWQKQKSDLKAIVAKKGAGTIFFTFSAADLHWPDLHNILVVNSCSLTPTERRQNVIDNPHLTDWFFVQRLGHFIKYWLYDTLDAEWHWYRFEYQARGSVHCHGIAKLKSDPGLCRLSEIALLGFKAQERLKTSSCTDDDNLLKSEGENASTIICNYADWLFSTENPQPPEEGNWVKPQNHPCQQRPCETDKNADLANLINIVQRHTHCSTKYCLKKVSESELQCRFNFPKPLCKETHLEFEPIHPHHNDCEYKLKVVTKRNDTRINNYQQLQLQNWRANCDIQLITSFRECIEYVTKYAAKGEPRSHAVKEAFCSVMQTSSSESCVRQALNTVIMKSLGQRDFSAQETMHHLLSLKLVSSTFKVVSVSLDGSRKVNSQVEGNNDQITCNSLLDFYANRHMFRDLDQDMMHMNFDQFATKYRTSAGKIVKQQNNIVVKFFPQIPSKADSAKYSLFCKYQLIRFKPWALHIHNAWDNKVDNPSTYPEEWRAFLSTEYAKATIVDWSEQMELIEDKIATHSTVSSHLARINTQHQEQEEWMQVASFVQHSIDQNSQLITTDSHNWSEARNNYTTQQLGEMPQWITQQKSHVLVMRESTQVLSTQSFTAMQQKAYDIVSNHYQSSVRGNSVALRMIINGEAGTGKSFLITALKNLLQDKCCITATTGKAAHNVNGITIHSLLKLPVSKQQAKALSGQSLIQLQDDLRVTEYIVIDEYSMLGQATMAWIDRRCREATGKVNDIFGGVSIILVGDPAQLPPVADKPLYFPMPHDSLCEQGYYAYLSFEKVIKLDCNKRISDLELLTTRQFVSILASLRKGKCTESDWKLLLTRQPHFVQNLVDFKYSTRLFFKNDDVAYFNYCQLKKLETPIALINAKHSSEKAKLIHPDEMGGLQPSIWLAVGAKVMLSLNLWTDAGLCNGATGTVTDIIYAQGQKPPVLPIAVMVCFDNYQGPSFCNLPNSVPICPATISHHSYDGHHERQQLPLKLAWAITIHKSQGLTLEKAWIDLGPSERVPGITYVAISRVRSLSSCVIEPMSLERLQNIGKSPALKYRLAEEERLQDLALNTIV